MATISRPHWSYSSISQFLRCPLQFYFERILKIPRTSVPSGLVFGSAMHDALEHYHTAIKHGDEIPWKQMQLYFLESWAIREAEKKVDYKPGENRNELTEQAVELLKLYIDEPPPKDILWVEQRFLVPVRNSLGDYLETPLLTVTDLITMDEGRLKVSEFKTSARAYSEFEVDTSLQATCYVSALWECLAKWATVEFTVLVKTKTPKIQRVKTQRMDDDFQRLGDIVQTVEAAVHNGVFYPVESPMNCSSCSYRTQCREWKPSLARGSELPLMETQGMCACSRI